MIGAVDPIFFSCYYSGSEFTQIGAGYFDTLGDIQKLGFNLVHNMGKIYDDIALIISMVNNPSGQGTEKFWTNVGFVAGDLLQQIAFTP